MIGSKMEKDLIVIGGGAAGFFAAITAAESAPKARVLMLEKSRDVLSKVRISGGGRCNVTHSCFDPHELVKRYPRGSKELLGPFHAFQPKDTIEWFTKRGVPLKTEEDGRMFPVTDSSQTIIDALTTSAKNAGVELLTVVKIESIEKQEGLFTITTNQGIFTTKALLLATGSSPQGHAFAVHFGHHITPLAPSLFSFNIPSSPLLDLSGISMAEVEASIEGTKLKEKGPLLITHWGFSGPSILRLSAWGARILQDMEYRATLLINWATSVDVREKIQHLRKNSPSKTASLQDLAPLPKNLADRLYAGDKTYAHLKNSDIEQIIAILTKSRYSIEGKTTYKQEFVTCGGIHLKEVNFQTMESKICPGLYFAGEILDIDGITGGFNFQNGWTTGFLAGKAVAKNTFC
jgi:predicted Rossmann fold flavoprotein